MCSLNVYDNERIENILSVFNHPDQGDSVAEEGESIFSFNLFKSALEKNSSKIKKHEEYSLKYQVPDDYVLVQGQKFGDIKKLSVKYRIKAGINPFKYGAVFFYWEFADRYFENIVMDGNVEEEVNKGFDIILKELEKCCKEKGIKSNISETHRKTKRTWLKYSNLSPGADKVPIRRSKVFLRPFFKRIL